MKKLMLLLVIAVFFVIVTKAQTFQDVKSENSAELQNLQKRLDDVKNRIYYLKITLPDRINKSGAAGVSKEDLKEQYFAPEELISLDHKKTKLENAITLLESSSYEVEEERVKKASPLNLPEKMSSREYRRRNRSQAFVVMEKSAAITDENGDLKGLLINDKVNLNENAYFQFERIDIREYVHRPNIMVPPHTEKIIFLPMGVYKCTMKYNSYVKESIVHVDPRSTVTVGTNNTVVHFWAQKDRWEY